MFCFNVYRYECVTLSRAAALINRSCAHSCCFKVVQNSTFNVTWDTDPIKFVYFSRGIGGAYLITSCSVFLFISIFMEFDRHKCLYHMCPTVTSVIRFGSPSAFKYFKKSIPTKSTIFIRVCTWQLGIYI